MVSKSQFPVCQRLALNAGLLTRGKFCANFLIAHDRRDFVFHVLQRNNMVFPIVGIDAVRRYNNLPVPLVSIDRGDANAGVSVNPGENKHVGLQSMEGVVKVSIEERAVTLLNHHRICGSYRETRRDLTPNRALDCGANSLDLHFWKCISEVRLELLANPNNGMPALTH